MTTIKSYTDIGQSSKLAKILALESADMKWFFWKSEIDAPKLPTFGYSKTAAESYKDTEAVYLPCWSLTALLGVLPMIDFTTPQLVGTPKTLYRCMYDDNLKSHACDNPIDACYEIIIKLYEQKLL